MMASVLAPSLPKPKNWIQVYCSAGPILAVGDLKGCEAVEDLFISVSCLSAFPILKIF